MRLVRSGLPLAAWVVLSASISAQDRVLTPDAVRELVAAQSPEVVLARARAAQAAGALITARARLASNPEASLFMGSRDGADGRSLDAELSLAQRFELGGQRGLRIESANAVLRQRNADIDAAVLAAQRVALSGLYRAAHAQQRRELSMAAVALAGDGLRAASARYEAGETAVLDVNVAKVEVARATRDQLASSALYEAAVADLREMLALPDGAVRIDVPFGAPAALPPLEELLARLPTHPDVEALQAAVLQAEAALKLTRASRTPDLVGGFGFRREDREPVLGGLIGISIPLFQRQEGAIATATARVTEAQSAVASRRAVLATRLRAAYARFTLAVQAADNMATTALPLIAENERLTRDSYQAGKIGQLDVLLIRREGFAARREALDAQLDAMLAALEVQGIAGVIK